MVNFTIENGKLLKTELTENIDTLIIPDFVRSIADGGLDITSNANKFNESVNKIVIPSSVSVCSLKAFKGFVNLHEIENLSPCFCVSSKMLLSKDKQTIFIAEKDISGILNIKWTFRIIIADYALEYCKSITKIDTGEYVARFGDYCFSHCESLTSIDLPHALKDEDLGVGMFADCYNLKELLIPHNITVIPEYFAQNCYALEYVRILDDRNMLKKISKYAFANCTSLIHFSYDKIRYNNMHLDSNLKFIEEKSFFNCQTLSEITILSTEINISKDAFSSCDKICFFCYKNTEVEQFLIRNSYRFYYLES